jgi:hypothetical protein
MNTYDGQTKTSRIEQQKEETKMTASAVGNGGHQRRERTNNRSIDIGGNNYKKERLETAQRKGSTHCEPHRTEMMATTGVTMKTNSTTALSGHLHTPAVCLVPQSTLPDSKGPTSETTTTTKMKATTATTTDNRTTTGNTPGTTFKGNTPATTHTASRTTPKAPFFDPTQMTTSSTSTSLHSNTAVRLVPQDSGSKGTNEKLTAGKKKRAEDKDAPRTKTKAPTAAEANQRWRQQYGDTTTQTMTTPTDTKMTAAEANLRWTQHYGDTTAGNTPAASTVETMKELRKSMQELLQNSQKRRQASERLEGRGHGEDSKAAISSVKSYGNTKIMAKDSYGKELAKKSMQDRIREANQCWQQNYTSEASKAELEIKIARTSKEQAEAWRTHQQEMQSSSPYTKLREEAKRSTAEFWKQEEREELRWAREQERSLEMLQFQMQLQENHQRLEAQRSQYQQSLHALEAERHRQAKTSRDTRKQRESYVREMHISTDIKRVKEEAISTNPSAISKTAVRLVPQSFGSKGIMENNQAGNELEEETQPSLDTSFGDDRNTNQPPTAPHAPGNNRGPIFHPQYMVTVTQRKAYRKQTLVDRPLLVKEPTNTQPAKDSSPTKAIPINLWTQQARGVRALHTSKSSYLLPLPWQHHSWIAPAHRKTLRQQPF